MPEPYPWMSDRSNQFASRHQGGIFNKTHLISKADLVRGGTANPLQASMTSNQSRPAQQGAVAASISPVPSPVSHYSPAVQTMLDQPPSTLPKRMIFGGIAFCLAFSAWSWFGRIEEVGQAYGRLIPQGNVYKIHPVELGKVARIAVKEGQAVRAGEVLVELDNQIAANEVERLQQEQSAYQVQLSQTQALIDKTRLEAQFLTSITAAEVRAQEAAIAQAKAQAAAQEVTIAQAQAKTVTTQQLMQQLQTDVAAQETRLARLSPLVEEGAIAKERLFEVEQDLRDRQSSIIQNKGELQQTLAESEKLQAELQQALAASNQLQAELEQKQAQGQTAQLEAEQKIQQLEVQKTQLQAKIDETEKLLAKAKAELKQRYLVAPIDGTITSLNIQNIGEVVQPSQTVAEMAASSTTLVLSASLPNREAGFVKPGMPAQLKFDAYPYQDYGVVKGTVTTISPDTQPDERLGPVYKVKVALKHNTITTKQQSIQFKAGQTATANIIIRQRRIADVLLDPIRQLQKGGLQM